MTDFKIVAHVVNDGFEFKSDMHCSADGQLAIASPSNIFLWNMKDELVCQDNVSSHFRPGSVIPCPNYESSESDSSGHPSDPRFDSISWSPLGVSTSGSCLLAVSARSASSVHIKILRMVRHYLSVTFSEAFSLTDELRHQWLRIPLYSPSLIPLSEKYASLSYVLSGVRSFVRWCPSGLPSSRGLLVTAWNDLVFIWIISEDSRRVLCCLSPTGGDGGTHPITSLSVSELESVGTSRAQLGLAVDLVGGSRSEWTVILDLRSPCVHAVSEHVSSPPVALTFAKPLGHKDFTSSVPEGVALSATSDGAFDYLLRRTSRSVQIMRRNHTPSISSLIASMIDLTSRTSRPLLDLAAGVAELYVPRPGKLEELSESELLRSVIKRLLGEDANLLDVSRLTPESATQLAVGLHHMHSRIDPIAASNPRARASERKLLLAVSGKAPPMDKPCTMCGEGHCGASEDVRLWICHRNDRKAPLCQLTMVPLTPEDETVTCCFCQSVYKFQDKRTETCRICRIGVADSLV